MFITGVTDDGSSSVPTRTTVNCGRADEFAKRCDPQRAQKRRRTSLPLSAFTVNSLMAPDTSTAEVGTTMFTVPFAAVRWQSRHQQIRVVMGSVEIR